MDEALSWKVIYSVGGMIFTQLFIQIIAWVKFTSEMNTRVSVLSERTSNAIKAFETHEILDSKHHRAAWEKIEKNKEYIEKHAIALAKGGFFNGGKH